MYYNMCVVPPVSLQRTVCFERDNRYYSDYAGCVNCTSTGFFHPVSELQCMYMYMYILYIVLERYISRV